MKHADHGGRLFPEDNFEYRTDIQRDRDRIIHSKAFRRLGYKTQVFNNSEGDNYRTRLTHSIEVSQIVRSVAAALHLNRDYTEALALAHDLGHPPFGHAGQDALQELMKDHGDFEHNRQSLRIVSELETRYLDFPGLNLCRATLVGMMKHERIYECDARLKEILALRRGGNPCLEAELVNVCDRIAYIHHDLEDGLDSNILSPDELFELPAWKASCEELEKTAGEKFRLARVPVRIRAVIRSLMNRCITDLIETSAVNLNRLQPQSLQDILTMPPDDYPVRMSPEMNEILADFQTLLYARLYRNPRVMQMSQRGRDIIKKLFEKYSRTPDLLPPHYRSRVEALGLPRVISDYISGMTDRFARQVC